MRLFCALSSSVLLLTLACAAPVEPPTPAPDLEAAKASLLAADRSWNERYSASDSPADVFADQMLDGAYLLPPGAPRADGREAIRQVVAELESLPHFSVTWVPSVAEVGPSGELGFTIGAYEMTLPGPDGDPATVSGKYLTVWRQQDDGSWMVAADMFNDNGAAPAGNPD